MRRLSGACICAMILFSALCSAARAEQAVKVGAAYALWNDSGSGIAAVLIPGGDGQMNIAPDATFSGLRSNQLVRTRKHYLSHGVSTLTIDKDVAAADAVAFLRRKNKRVVVVATSRGSLRVPASLAGRPSAVVLTAAMLFPVKNAIGSANRLPPTLVVHHRRDACRVTPPDAVNAFTQWGGSKVKVAWFEGGISKGNPCRARAYHGFNGLDGAVVARVARYIKLGQ